MIRDVAGARDPNVERVRHHEVDVAGAAHFDHGALDGELVEAQVPGARQVDVELARAPRAAYVTAARELDRQRIALEAVQAHLAAAGEAELGQLGHDDLGHDVLARPDVLA